MRDSAPCAAQLLYAPQRARFFLSQGEAPPAPHSLFGGAAATAHLGRAASAALTQGAPVWGDRSLFNQKGPPLRCAQWGTKRRCRLAVPEKNRRGSRCSLPHPKHKKHPRHPHSACGKRSHPAQISRLKRRGLRGKMVPFPAALCAAGTPMGWTLVAPFLELPPSCAALAALANRARPAVRCRTALPQKRRDFGGADRPSARRAESLVLRPVAANLRPPQGNPPSPPADRRLSARRAPFPPPGGRPAH